MNTFYEHHKSSIKFASRTPIRPERESCTRKARRKSPKLLKKKPAFALPFTIIVRDTWRRRRKLPSSWR